MTASNASTTTTTGRKTLTVSEVNRWAKVELDKLPQLWVVGEVSNLKQPASGHVYLSLKDNRCQLSAVIWKGAANRLRFPLANGLEVACRGKLTLYEPRGQYQMVIDRIEACGEGAAERQLRELKARLEKEGLFDPARKRPLPRFPQTIALVTSTTGAAIRDMLDVIDRRYPKVRVVVCHTRVQGSEAPAEVFAALRAVCQLGTVDVIIVGRGGGSSEDLWAFNNEHIARAIAASPVPVISSVGHAIDTTIADLVADRRALTPTEAAELATPLLTEIVAQLERARDRMGKALTDRVARLRDRLRGLERSYALREPFDRIRRYQQQLDDRSAQLNRALGSELETQRFGVAKLAARLDALSPLAVLTRGYSVTTHAITGTLITTTSQVAPGMPLRTRLSHGDILSEVKELCPTARTS